MCRTSLDGLAGVLGPASSVEETGTIGLAEVEPGCGCGLQEHRADVGVVRGRLVRHLLEHPVRDVEVLAGLAVVEECPQEGAPVGRSQGDQRGVLDELLERHP